MSIFGRQNYQKYQRQSVVHYFFVWMGVGTAATYKLFKERRRER
jgi:hypothetical protein